MMGEQALHAHLAQGTGTVCRAWALMRRDGQMFGFTDHDGTLSFEGITFKANAGLTAKVLSQTTGLAVDNSEAVGALSDVSVTEADIEAGRFDGAELRAWLVNWADPQARVMQFRGALGDISRAGGAFTTELRGLTEALNQPQGRVYQPGCAAVLGDGQCRVDLDAPGYFAERMVEKVAGAQLFRFSGFTGFDDRWFERGRLRVLSGVAEGLVAVIKNDRLSADGREVELWQALNAEVRPGDMVRLEAGCDKRADTCRLKFHNFMNFRGFPHVPGDDWITTYPSHQSVNDGGKLR